MFINRPEARIAAGRASPAGRLAFREDLDPNLIERIAVPERRPPTPRPAPEPAPVPAQPPPAPVPLPVPVIPAVAGANPFTELPFPAPGDRIKADDFKKLSQGLMIIANMALISAQLFGRTLGEAKVALAGQGYAVARVLTVFGSEPGSPNDPSFDGRRVMQVLPAALGENAVLVMVTEAVETRRFAPNFTAGGVNYTYRQALETMRSLLGEAGMSGLPMDAPNLLEKTLAQATREIG